MWKDTGIRLGISCKNTDCGNCITGRCVYPERNFSLNISESGTCENFVPKEKYSADILSLIRRLRTEAKANHQLRADFVEYISKSIRRNSEIEKLKADRLAEGIIGDFVEGLNQTQKGTLRMFSERKIEEEPNNIQEMKESINDVKGAVKIVRDNLIEDKDLYEVFVTSIESAIEELPPRIDRRCAAMRIADRIMGREE